MAQLRFPTSHRKRLYLLQKCTEETALDKLDGRSYVIPASLETTMQTFLTSYAPAVKAVADGYGKRGREVDEKTTAVAALERYVRDFWEVLERRIVREELPRGLFMEYQQLRSGENPDGRSLEDWLTRSQDIIDGEARAVADGFAPMANPSAAEVAAKRDAARAEAIDVGRADSALDSAQHTLDALTAEADKLIRLMNAQLEITMYDLSAEDKRHVKERYGFTYYDQETAIDEEEKPPITPELEPPV